MKKKILSIILSVVMIVTFVPGLTAGASTKVMVKTTTIETKNDGNSHTIAGEFRGLDDTGASGWAIDEIESAIDNDLVTDAVTYDYQANITREEFCELVVLLYEKLTDTTAAVGSDVFYDTSNRSVRKAYNLGIVNGVSSDRFAPDNFITRQEICAMLVRAIGVIYTGIDLDDYDYTSFADSYSISSWAMDAVQFAYDNDIMRGVGNGKINPLGNTTCEQAILLVNRIYENRRDFESMDEDNRERLAKENEKNKVKTLSLRNDDEVEAISVTFDDGRNASSVKIKEVTDDDDMIYTTTGILGSAVDITYSKRFDGATISFEYNEDGLGEVNPSDLAIGWYNTDLDRVEILSSRVDTYSHTVSVETTHFSRYILVDSKEWYSVWQKGQMIVRETDKNGNYAEDFNVQLVVDCSGSMDGDRIVKARECTLEFINKLSLYDMFSVIKFGSEAVTVIDPVSVLDANMDEVEQVVMSLSDGGGTNFDNALRECINGLKSSNVDYDDYNNIIVFLSDGGSEVSDSLLEELSDKGIRIAAVALGSGSDSERMKHLSDSTNGQYIYAESSEALDTIFDAIQGSLIGVDATDTDGDGIPDIIEVTGMKNQYGAVIRTDPYEYDTDGDGDSDGEEMGSLVETDEVTDMDRANGITKNVYFQMVSNPLDGVRDTDFKLDDERTLGKFSGLPATMTLNLGQTEYIDLNRRNAKLTINDESVAEIDEWPVVENIDGSIDNITSFNIIPKYPGEATLTAIAPDGQKLKCKLTVNAKVGIVSSDATIIDSEGKFTLKLNIDVEGTAKNMTLEFKKLDDCLSYSWSQGDYDAFGGDFTALVDLDGISGGGFILEEYSSGKHEEELRFTCSNTEDLGRCDNRHEILIKVYGDNFEPSEYTAKIYTQEEWEEHQREIERQNEERRRREMNKDINAMQQDMDQCQ